MSRTSEQRQLELELGDVVLRIPWCGQSPRELTRVRIELFSRRKAQKSVSEFVDPAQIEIWPEHVEGPGSSAAGAPFLKGARHRRSRYGKAK